MKTFIIMIASLVLMFGSVTLVSLTIGQFKLDDLWASALTLSIVLSTTAGICIGSLK